MEMKLTTEIRIIVKLEELILKKYFFYLFRKMISSRLLQKMLKVTIH